LRDSIRLVIVAATSRGMKRQRARSTREERMTATVTLVTDRPAFVPVWRDVLERHAFAVRVHAPSDLGRFAVLGSAVVFDAASDSLDDDDLLTGVGYVRAAGGVAIVHAEGDLEPIVLEVALGLITRAEPDVERVVRTLGRRLDLDRGKRFEFVTVAPDDEDVLAILGDGQSVLLKRPLATQDDGTEVVGIVLSDDAASATLELARGAWVELDVATVAPASTSTSGAIPIDGARLGARLRELRLSAGLTQAELARRTGIHRPNIARVEAGRHTPSLETLARLATAIGVPTTRVLAAD